MSKAKSPSAADPPPITAPLPPPPYPLGVLPDYTRHTTPITLRIRELKSSIGGDDFLVKDAHTNHPSLQVQAKMFSFSAKKTMRDSTGRPLFDFRRTSTLSLKKEFAGFTCDTDKQLFVVRMVGLFKPKLEIEFCNRAANGRVERWTLRGRWMSGSSQITTDEGLVVASISRDYANMGQIFFNVQTYDVTVAPGVDAALVSALCVCFDEAYNDSSNGHRF
ncbi:hypothetical protein [Sporisorium scitamineum]|uniref:DUF567 domain protein n=1 Tax=Sporisorium scitamineum TaxID=49012 RepID=A0A0F7RW54_9BASI|nr:hypothetical protein [Sporisorium scitamineum]